jgi:DNA-directed RNA polymerase specialized sigma24 family protein
MITEIKKPDLVTLIDDDYTGMVEGMAYKYANMYGGYHGVVNKDDLVGEGMLATLKAYELYDELKGKFRTYAWVYVDKAMLAYCNKFRFKLSMSNRDLWSKMGDIKEAHSGLMHIDEIDIPYTPIDHNGIDLEDYFYAGLTKTERDMVHDRLINGMKFQDIANKHDMSLSGVYNKIKKITSILKIRGAKYVDESDY